MRYSKESLETLYNDLTTGQFKDAQAIPISRLRQLVEDLVDSVLFLNDDGNGPWKQDRVRLKTTAALPANTGSYVDTVWRLTADANGALTIDGVAVANDDTVLISEESDIANNGCYDVIDAGGVSSPFILALRIDSRDASQIALAVYTVLFGDTNANTLWKQVHNETGAPITTVEYEEFSSGSGSDTEATGTILTANVLTGFASPVSLVAAPGSGIANIPTEIVLWMDYNSVAYATNVVCDVQIGGTSVTGGGIYGLLDRSSDGGIHMLITSQEIAINAAITFKVLTGNPTLGNSNIKYSIKYKTITI